MVSLLLVASTYTINEFGLITLKTRISDYADTFLDLGNANPGGVGGGNTGADTGGWRDDVAHTPIPAPILMLGIGLIGLVGFRSRKMEKKS